MSDVHEYKERLRRWGWVAVGMGLPGAALLGYEGYLIYVDYHEPMMAEAFMVFALLAPFLVGVRMIVSGYRPDMGGHGGEEGEEPREEEGLQGSEPKTRAAVIRPAFLVGMAVFLTGLGYLAVPVCGCSTREKAYEAAMKSDLKNLASQEEIYFSDNHAYSSSTADLAFTNSDGVMVHLVATPTGWTANTWHAALGQGVGCAMFYGNVDFVLRTGGGSVPAHPGEYLCDEF